MQPSDFEKGLGRGARKYVEAGVLCHNLKLTDEQLDEAVELRLQNIHTLIKTEGLPSFPGVLELAQAALARADFSVAIASSAERKLVYAILEAVKMPYQKMARITGCDVKHKKPNPQIFQLAIGKINLPEKNCVVIEDAPDGIAAAKAAGCKCIAVTNSLPADRLEQADLIVNDLTGLDPDSLIELIES